MRAQKEDVVLKTKLETTLNGFNGNVGIFVKNLKTNKFVAINADTIFPTASMVKIPIMIGTFDKILKGEYKYDQDLSRAVGRAIEKEKFRKLTKEEKITIFTR